MLLVGDQLVVVQQTQQEEDLPMLKLSRWGPGMLVVGGISSSECWVGGWVRAANMEVEPARLPGLDAASRLAWPIAHTLMLSCLPAGPCRQLWLYVGIYDFAALQQQNGQGNTTADGTSGRWPIEWRASLGRVAAVTPLLIVGWEQFKPDEMLESLASEFATRLTMLGTLGEPPALSSALQGVLGGAVGPQLPGPMVRFVTFLCWLGWSAAVGHRGGAACACACAAAIG